MTSTSPHFLLFSSCHAHGSDLRWRFVLEDIEGSERVFAEDREADAGSERLELLAVVRGLEALPQPARVTLLSNSRYVSQGIDKHLENWRSNDWRWERFGRREPIRDADLWQRVDRALKFHELKCHRWPFEESAQDTDSCSEFTPDHDSPRETIQTAEPLAPKHRVDELEPAVLVVRRSDRGLRAHPRRQGMRRSTQWVASWFALAMSTLCVLPRMT